MGEFDRGFEEYFRRWTGYAGDVQVLVNSFFEAKVEQLFEVLRRLKAACEEAGVEYELIGGLAVYLHINRIDPLAARLTRDVDINVRRSDIDALSAVASRHGFEFRHAEGIDMLVDPSAPKARSAVHIVASGARIRPHYVTTVPEPAPVSLEGYSVAPVAHLVAMKLTSYRPKDMAHLQDLLAVGLITPEVEGTLPDVLRDRLQDLKAMEA